MICKGMGGFFIVAALAAAAPGPASAQGWNGGGQWGGQGGGQGGYDRDRGDYGDRWGRDRDWRRRGYGQPNRGGPGYGNPVRGWDGGPRGYGPPPAPGGAPFWNGRSRD
jgi:hypothetical protein